MECKSQISLRNDGSPGDEQSRALSSWSPEDGFEPPKIDRSRDIALVTRLLDRSYGCHGVCNEKILLWGLAGCG